MSSASVLENAVASHPFVRGMSVAHVRLLAQSAMVTQFEPGTIVFHEGDIANRFYLIQHGRVSVEAGLGKQGAMTVQILGAGDVLGWSWLFSPYYWHFSARATEPTEALFFYGTRLREHCELDPGFGYELMKRVAAVLMWRLQASIQTTLRIAEARPGNAEADGGMELKHSVQ